MVSRRCGYCRRDRRVDFKPEILLWRSALCQNSEEVGRQADPTGALSRICLQSKKVYPGDLESICALLPPGTAR